MPLLRRLLADLRLATCLLAIDRAGLRLRIPLRADRPLDVTERKVLAAAVALGALHRTPGELLTWTDEFAEIAADDGEWHKVISIIEHQASYLAIVRDWESGSSTPAQQLDANPAAYLSFLRGVDASHKRHADWVASVEPLRSAKNLVDLGAGLGTFSVAWIASRSDRSAVLVDLPCVGQLLAEAGIGPNPRLKFIGVDLAVGPVPEFAGDACLLANVLHLFADWQRVLRVCVERMPPGSRIAVLEASPEGNMGALFDLQVHLRSGRTGGLLWESDVRTEMKALGLGPLTALSQQDPHDPFERAYNLWIGRRWRR